MEHNKCEDGDCTNLVRGGLLVLVPAMAVVVYKLSGGVLLVTGADAAFVQGG